MSRAENLVRNKVWRDELFRCLAHQLDSIGVNSLADPAIESFFEDKFAGPERAFLASQGMLKWDIEEHIERAYHSFYFFLGERMEARGKVRWARINKDILRIGAHEIFKKDEWYERRELCKAFGFSDKNLSTVGEAIDALEDKYFL